MAAPARLGGGPTTGVITIAGPVVRLTMARMLALGPELLSAADELAMASAASPLFARGAPVRDAA